MFMELGGWEKVGVYYGCICDEGLAEYIEEGYIGY
mgnify:CR=1 FL=1